MRNHIDRIVWRIVVVGECQAWKNGNGEWHSLKYVHQLAMTEIGNPIKPCFCPFGVLHAVYNRTRETDPSYGGPFCSSLRQFALYSVARLLGAALEVTGNLITMFVITRLR